jgi:glycogen operon protein
MVVDSLATGLKEMHVDGFRFGSRIDLFARDSNGNAMSNPPVLGTLSPIPVLAGTKMIAEAWTQPGYTRWAVSSEIEWKEWNGCFRDDVRSLFRLVDNGAMPRFADRFYWQPRSLMDSSNAKRNRA